MTIITRLIAKEAKKEGITVTDSEVDEELERMVPSIAQPQDSFEEMQKSRGFTFAYTKAMIRNQLLADKILRKRAVVTPEEMAQYRGIKQINLIRTASHAPRMPGTETPDGANPNDPDEELTKKIEQIALEIKDGLSFDEAIKKYSADTGMQQAKDAMRWYKLGSAPADFDKAISELEVNQISAPVKSPMAYHLIQVVYSGDKVIGTQTAELKEVIINSKINARAWMIELREEAKIESKLVAKQMGAVPDLRRLRRLPANSQTTEGVDTPPAPPTTPASPPPYLPSPPAQ